ncbi:MAG: hypothetical protein Q8N76_08355, partial [Candidatus Omnitrophota bacterium]|nr:hypothetical protein [Candidatus Omnitrophota bacterium]
MMITSSMELLSIIVLKDKIEDISYRLLKLGIFHPVDIRHIEEELSGLSPYEIDREHAEWDELDARLKENLRKLDIAPAVKKDIKAFSYDDIKNILGELENSVNPFLNEKNELEAGLEAKNSMFTQLKSYPLFSLRRESVYSFLEVSLGKVVEKNISVIERSLKDIPYVFYPFKKDGDKVIALLIGLRRDRVFIDRVLKDIAWEKIEYPKNAENISKEVEGKLSIEIQAIKKRQQDINSEIRKTGESYQDSLS